MRGLRLPERYEVRRHLATGGMASVWCAQDLVLGRAVAIKVLAERFAHDEMAMRRFKREARAAARVSNHAHVVTIFDVGDLDVDEASAEGLTRPFIVMEYLAGGTVADAIRLDAVRRQEAVRWLREAASALDHAHARGIVHRDIKPVNFLLNRSRVLHVADFGIARLVSEDTISTSDQLFGTAAYLAPEQALGREATSASDRYALAVAAFELLTGRRPFEAQHFAAQARQHIEDEPPRASSLDRTLPASVDDVLMRGMAKQPEERYDSAGEFVDALETALSGGVPITARPPYAARRRRPSSLRLPEAPRVQAPVVPPVPAPVVARRDAVAGSGGVGLPAAPAVAAAAVAGDPAPLTLVGEAPAVADDDASAAARPRSVPVVRRSVAPRRRRRSPAIGVALALVALVAAGALVAMQSLGGSPVKRSAAVQVTKPAHTSPVVLAPRPRPRRRHRPKPAPVVTAPAPATSPAPTAAQLQTTGHQEMLAGDYQSAIATLRRAVAAAPRGSLTYAYGLYDLGRSLYLAGNADAAVPVLEARARIPNQTAVVKQALEQALRASGQVPGSMTTGAGAPSPAQSGATGQSGAPGQRHGTGRGHGAGRHGAASSPGHGSHHPSQPAPPSASGGAGILPPGGSGGGSPAAPRGDVHPSLAD